MTVKQTGRQNGMARLCKAGLDITTQLVVGCQRLRSAEVELHHGIRLRFDAGRVGFVDRGPGERRLAGDHDRAVNLDGG